MYKTDHFFKQISQESAALAEATTDAVQALTPFENALHASTHQLHVPKHTGRSNYSSRSHGVALSRSSCGNSDGAGVNARALSTPPTLRGGQGVTDSLLPVTATFLADDTLEKRRVGATDRSVMAAHLVTDPLAMLRQCIHFIANHPETYGRNIRGVLDREVMYALRLKASELALLTPQTMTSTNFTVADAAAPGATTMTTTSSTLFTARRQQGTIGGASGALFGSVSLPPLQYGSTGKRARLTALTDRLATPGAGGPMVQNVGHISFVQPSTGFMALLETAPTAAVAAAAPAVTPAAAMTMNAMSWKHSRTMSEQHSVGPQQQQLPAVQESIEWDGTHPGTLDDGDETVERTGSSGGYVSNIGDTTAHFTADAEGTGGAATAPVVIDGGGYEISFLRAQLQQVEAAYNSKCIRMHELVEENGRLLSQLRASDESGKKWLEAYNAAQVQLEVMRRELEGWKDRAADASAQASTLATRNTSQARRAASNQLHDVKQEVAKLSQLWRETERALQESRRAYENAEKEANESHDHLSDAFHYIERLERRLERRDAFIRLVSRRQMSLEEKYEKLMWCFEELGTMSGSHSFADFLLADDPLWSCMLFIRTQRHMGDFRAVIAAPLAPSSQPLAPSGGTGEQKMLSLTYWKSPGGGVLADDSFDTTLIYNVMAGEATALDDRRRKTRRLRTNLHGTVGCRVLRSLNLYAIDFLGGEDNIPDSCDINRHKLPLLTLAAVTLPLRNPDGSRLFPPGAGDAPSASESAGNSAVVSGPVPNSKQYNQATLRYLLYAFWRGRMQQFRQDMLSRRENVINEFKCAERRRLRALRRPGQVLRREEVEESSAEEDDEGAGASATPPVKSTFLAALVDFTVEVAEKGGGTGVTGDTKTNQELRATQLSVRAVLSRNDGPDVWDNGRLFFAAVLPAASERWPDGGSSSKGDGPAQAPEVTIKVRELLCALYYFALEYKDSDADFRLFYLTSHQLIPEMVGVNFYANIEAFQRDCFTILQQRLCVNTPPAAEADDGGDCPAGADGYTTTTVMSNQASPVPTGLTDNPLGVLTHVAHLVDTTPLVAETETVEPDSDGEGYGGILPGKRADAMEGAAQYQLGDARGSGWMRSSVRTGSPDFLSELRQSPRSGVASRAGRLTDRASERVAEADKSLVHTIREYLESLKRVNTAVVDSRDGATVADAVGDVCAPLRNPIPEAWEALNTKIMEALGPHASMLKNYQDSTEVAHRRRLRSATFQDYRADRKHFDTTLARPFAAARGLLHMNDIIALLQKHCFSTYALTCCGPPRFSLARSLFPPVSGNAEDYISPLDIVGQVPPTEIDLKRLRFALALDQPSSLIRFTALFDIDCHTATPSNFYDEYLTLVLDTFQQQQRFLLNSLHRACASRHEQYAAEGAEDCDGHIPVSYLRRGLVEAFATLSVGAGQGLAFADHLVNYDSLLRHEDEVRLEQFTDAPFFINTAPTSTATQAAPTANMENTWDLHAEAETCSLLHLSLAVRMTYVVWGTEARDSAMKLMRHISSIPILQELSEKRSTGGIGNAGPRSSAAVLAPTMAMENEDRLTLFARSVKALYVRAANRLALGHSGDHNPLRRTCRALDEETWNAEHTGASASAPKSGTDNSSAIAKAGIPGGGQQSAPNLASPPQSPWAAAAVDAALPFGCFPNFKRFLRTYAWAVPEMQSTQVATSGSKGTQRSREAQEAVATLPEQANNSLTALLGAPSLPTSENGGTDRTYDPAQLSLARLLGLSVAAPVPARAGQKKKGGGGAATGAKKGKGSANGAEPPLRTAMTGLIAANLVGYVDQLRARLPRIVLPRLLEVEGLSEFPLQRDTIIGTSSSLPAGGSNPPVSSAQDVVVFTERELPDAAATDPTSRSVVQADLAANWSLAFDESFGRGGQLTLQPSEGAGGDGGSDGVVLNISHLHACSAAMNLM